MNAKTRNSALTAAFKYGGRGDVLLWGKLESDRQIEESCQREKEEAYKIMVKGLKSFGEIKECPCGCGLKGDICQAHASVIVAKNEEIPF